MIISIIAAHGKNLQLGLNGKMPWHLPDDLKHFRKLTWGHVILMGRKTFESIGRPLPGRKTIVISRNTSTGKKLTTSASPSTSKETTSLIWVDSISKGINWAQEQQENELFVIGGGEIYKSTLSLAQRMYITEVSYDGDADTFFPQYDSSEWKVIETTFPEDPNTSSLMKFITLERKVIDK